MREGKIEMPFSYQILDSSCPICGNKLAFVQYSASLITPFVAKTDTICSCPDCGISMTEYREGTIKPRVLEDIKRNLENRRYRAP